MNYWKVVGVICLYILSIPIVLLPINGALILSIVFHQEVLALIWFVVFGILWFAGLIVGMSENEKRGGGL